MPGVLEAARRLWRDHLASPSLRTYEDARNDLGGEPWKRMQSTDSWFLAKPDTLSQRLPSFEQLPTLDTGALVLRRPDNKLLLIGGAALLVIATCLIMLAGNSRPPSLEVASATIPSPATTQAPSPATIVVPPVVVSPTHAIAAPKASPSVQALFAPHKHVVARKRHR